MPISEVLDRMKSAVMGAIGGQQQQPPASQDGNVAPQAGLSEAQQQYGVNFENLKKLKPALVAALQQLTLEYRLETMYADRYRIRQIKYARLFWQGIQYAGWNHQTQDYDAFGGAAGSAFERDNEEAGPRFEYVTNWYQGYGLSFVALVSSDVPSLSIYPKSREVQEDISAAKVGYDVADVVERNNNPHKALETIGRYLWTDGICGQYWRYVVDGERFGYKTMPVIQPVQSQMDGQPITIPQQTGEQKIPQGQERVTYVGGLELALPFYADDFHDYPYLQWNTEPHMAKLKAAYPHCADEIAEGAGLNAEQVYERLARLGVKQNIRAAYPGDALAILPTFSRTWLRKWAFKRLENKEVVAELEGLFPDGCYVAFAGFTYCESRSESMDDHWRVRHALPGDGQHRPSVGGALISPQERYNILSNLQSETYEYGIPPIYADPQVLDFDAIGNQVAEPAAHFPARARPGMALEQGFFQPDPAKEPMGLAQTMQEIAGPTMQFLCGMFPAIFGGEMSDVKTASGYQMARDQAMGRLGLVWRGIKDFYADGIKLGLELFKANRPEDVEISFPGENDEEKAKWIRLGDFKGNFMVEYEPDEGLPRLKSQQRAVLEQILGMGANMPPAVAKALSDPKNLGWIKTVMGLNEMTIPGEDSAQKQQREIQILLSTPPISFPPQPTQQVDPATGQASIQMAQAPPQPTVPIDVLLDDHDAEWQACFDFASSDEGQTARKENPQGFQNFSLHAQAHFNVIQQKLAGQKQQKPPSESIALKDLPPDGQAQMAAQAGIQLSPEDLQAHQDQQRQDKADELKAKLGAKSSQQGEVNG